MFRILWIILGLFGFKNPLSSALLEKVLGAVGPKGLSTILDLLKTNGLGDMVKSWLSTGPNPKITGDQLVQGLGSNKLQDLAQQAGLPVDQLTATLVKALLGLVDKLSPDGTLQEDGWMEKAMGMIAK